MFSPHTRGWPVFGKCCCYRGAAFSPHTRGWPGVGYRPAWEGVRSPRTRGDGPPGRRCPQSFTAVLPAHAGMARRSAPRAGTQPTRSPRTRGDGPEIELCDTLILSFSPHTRGWPGMRGAHLIDHQGSPRTRGDGPCHSDAHDPNPMVLPAHAGMARDRQRAPHLLPAFSPHTRGWPV